MARIVTGEAVALDLRVALVGSRLLAAAIDIASQVAVLTIALLALRPALAGADPALGGAIVLVVIVVALVGYPVTIETLTSGRSLGKMALGLRVVRADGGPVRFRHALVRGLVGGLVEKPGLSVGAAAVISSMVSVRGQRLGDLMAGTVVLQERVPVVRAFEPIMPPPLAAWATTLDLSRLPDSLALSIRQFLGRSAELLPTAREDLGTRLATAVAAVVTPTAPYGTPGWAYLTAILAERRRRAVPVASGGPAYPIGMARHDPVSYFPPALPTAAAPETPPLPAGDFHAPG